MLPVPFLLHRWLSHHTQLTCTQVFPVAPSGFAFLLVTRQRTRKHLGKNEFLACTTPPLTDGRQGSCVQHSATCLPRTWERVVIFLPRSKPSPSTYTPSAESEYRVMESRYCCLCFSTPCYHRWALQKVASIMSSWVYTIWREEIEMLTVASVGTGSTLASEALCQELSYATRGRAGTGLLETAL